MRPATPVVSSIPLAASSSMVGLLSGLPLVDAEYSLAVRSEITESEVAVVFDRLARAERAVIVRSHCKAGDLWNTLHTDAFKLVCVRWKANIRLRMGDKSERYFRMLSKFGTVASNWPPDKRTDKHGWTYMRTHDPDGAEISGKSKGLPFFVSVAPMIEGGDVRFEFASTGARHVVGRITSEHLEAIRVAMGWVRP